MKKILYTFCLSLLLTPFSTYGSPDLNSIDYLRTCLLQQTDETITLLQLIGAKRSVLLEDLQVEQSGWNRHQLEQTSTKSIATLQELTQLGALVESIGILNRYRQRQLMLFKKSLNLHDQEVGWQRFLSKLEIDEKKTQIYISALRVFGVDSEIDSCKL